jgi:hypothetical protein
MDLVLGGEGYVAKAEALLPHSKGCPPEGGRNAWISVLTFAGRALKMNAPIAKTAESGAPEQI